MKQLPRRSMGAGAVFSINNYPEQRAHLPVTVSAALYACNLSLK